MKRLLPYLIFILVFLTEVKPTVGEVVEQASVGAMFSVLFGFVSGEIAWIASPKFEEEEDPYRVKQPAAVATAYCAGVPFGAALGVHLGSLTTSRPSNLWARWAGAEISTLAASGVGYLIVSLYPNDTTPRIDGAPEVVAAALPIAAGVAGAFAGEAIARKLGWTASGTPPVEFGLKSQGEEFVLYCGVRFRF